MSFESLDELGKGGVALSLAGGLIAFAPTFERFLYAPTAWVKVLLLTLVAAAVLGGAALAIREHPALGGVIAGLSGIVLVFFGPTTGGVLATVGGAILFFDARREPSGTDGSTGRVGSPEP